MRVVSCTCVLAQQSALCMYTSTIFALLFSLPPSRNSDQPLGHIAGAPPPSPLRFVSCFFVARKLHPFFALVDWRPIAPVIPTLRVLSSGSLFFFGKKEQINTVGLELTGSTLAAFEGTTKPPGRHGTW